MDKANLIDHTRVLKSLVFISFIYGTTSVKFHEASIQWSELLSIMRTDHWEVVRGVWERSWLLHMHALDSDEGDTDQQQATETLVVARGDRWWQG